MILDHEAVEDLQRYVKEQMPFKFARTLLKKVRHKPEPLKLCYWELDHTKGKPFIIALHDYSRRLSMSISMPALQSYLYGVDMDSGSKIEQHLFENRSIPSNFSALIKMRMSQPYYLRHMPPSQNLIEWE